MESVSGFTSLTGAFVLILGPQRCAGVDGWPWHCKFFREVRSPTCVKGKEEMFFSWLSQRMRQNWTGWKSSFLLQGRQNVPPVYYETLRDATRNWSFTAVLQHIVSLASPVAPEHVQSCPRDTRFSPSSLTFYFRRLSEHSKLLSLVFIPELFQYQALPPVPAAHQHLKSLCGPW